MTDFLSSSCVENKVSCVRAAVILNQFVDGLAFELSSDHPQLAHPELSRTPDTILTQYSIYTVTWLMSPTAQ